MPGEVPKLRHRSVWGIVPGATVFFSNGCIVTLAAVVCGMAAAQLGASLYVWTAVIAVALTGLAAGSYLGGRLADRFHPRRAISVLYALSSAACVSVVIVNNALAAWTGLWSLYWPLHVLLHVTGVLLLPCLLLAAVMPVAARITVDGGATAGRALGNLCAWAACGGIAAVVVTGFFLIPTYGHVVIVWSISVASLAMAFLYWISCWVLYLWSMVFGVVLVLATAQAPWADQTGTAAYLRCPRDRSILYRSQTPYGQIVVEQVSQRPDTRVLLVDQTEQCTVLLGDPTNVRDFPAAIGASLMAGLTRAARGPSILFLGSGGYVLPRYAKAIWPQSDIDVVEQNPGVTAAAASSLGLDPTAIETICSNPATYVNVLQRRQGSGKPPKRHDLIYAQFANPFDVPAHLVTKQFNDQLSRILADDGAYVMSVVDTADGGRFLGAVVGTLERTFSHVQVIARAVDHRAAVESFVVVAAWRPLNLAGVLGSHQESPAFRVLGPSQLDQLKKRCSGTILTDERSPAADLLAPAVREAVSTRLARKYMHQASLLQREGQDGAALALCQQAARIDSPDRADACAAIGRWDMAQGNLKQAAEALDAALRYATESGSPAMTVAQLHVDLAAAMERTKQPSAARQHLAAAAKQFQIEVRQHPKAFVAWERLGDVYVLLQRWSEASNAFARCVELEPANPAHYDKLARALESQKRYDEAIATVRRQIDLLKKSGQKEAVIQQSRYMEYLEYQRVKQR